MSFPFEIPLQKYFVSIERFVVCNLQQQALTLLKEPSAPLLSPNQCFVLCLARLALFDLILCEDGNWVRGLSLEPILISFVFVLVELA